MSTTEMPTRLWVYRARVERVVDGDTLDAVLDAGFHGYRTERLRLLGLNAPEVHGPSRLAGLAATAWARDWLSVQTPGDAWPLLVETRKSDAFGRYLGIVWRTVDGGCLNQALLAAGYAVPFLVEKGESAEPKPV